MSGESGIEWCDRSWEVVAGCTKVSSGCANCYAERLVGTRHAGVARKRKRDGTDNGSAIDLSLEVINGKGRWSGDVRLLEMNLGQPLSRKAPTVYFVNSRSDLFHEDVPFEYIDRVFAVMALCPQHRFLVLTKRPERMRAYLADAKQRVALIGREKHPGDSHDCYIDPSPDRDYIAWPLPNVWLGTSVEDQETANTRLPELLACPAAGRFVSAEPLLGAVDLTCVHLGGDSVADDDGGDRINVLDYSWYDDDGDEYFGHIDWVIVGGESGPGSRVCNVAWIRSVVEQCTGAGVPVFVKQLGADPRGPYVDPPPADEGYPPVYEVKSRKGNDMAEWPTGLRVREVPAGLVVQETPSVTRSRDTSPVGTGEEKVPVPAVGADAGGGSGDRGEDGRGARSSVVGGGAGKDTR
jgi:protein gp37